MSTVHFNREKSERSLTVSYPLIRIFCSLISITEADHCCILEIGLESPPSGYCSLETL